MAPLPSSSSRAVRSGPRPRALLAGAAIAILAATSLGCSGDDDPNAPSAEPALGLGESGPGTCLLFTDDVGAEVTTLPVVDCSVPHSHEIYAVEQAPGDVYPGFDELENTAQLRCLAAFEPFVGSNPFDSELFHTWLVPTLDGWNDEDDREIICVVGDAEGEPLTGTVRDSGR